MFYKCFTAVKHLGVLLVYSLSQAAIAACRIMSVLRPAQEMRRSVEYLYWNGVAWFTHEYELVHPRPPLLMGRNDWSVATLGSEDFALILEE